MNPKHKMGKQAFDSGSRKPFQLGSQWWWRVDQLACEGATARLLIAYHLGKQSYIAWLALDRGGDHAVVACLEYHGDHPGWHYHTRCADVTEFQGGVQRQRTEGIRIPGKARYHRRQSFDMSHQEAISRAYKAFNIGAPAEGDLL